MDSKLLWQKQVQRLNRKRWIMIAPLAIAIVITFFHRGVIGVIADSLSKEFDISRAADLGILSSIYFYTYAALQIPSGIAADLIGPRRMILAATLTAGVGTLIFGVADSLSGLYAGRFFLSVGLGFVYVSALKIYAEWFRSREFGMMCGVSALIGNAGVVLAATPYAVLVEAIGWRSSYYLVGVATLLIAGCCWTSIRNRPAELGLPSIREVEAVESGLVDLEPTDIKPATLSEVLGNLRVVVGNPYTWRPFIVCGGMFGVYITFAGIWGIPYLMQIYEMSRVTAANYIVAVSVGYMVGSPIVGIVSDRILRRRLPWVMHAALMLVAWMTLTIWNGGKPPEWSLFPLCFLIGFGASGAALTLACAKEVNPPGMIGVATGTVNVGAPIGAALIQPAFGWLLDLNWQGAVRDGVKIYPLEAYQAGFWLCAAVIAGAMIMAMFLKETYCQHIADYRERSEEV